MNIKLPITASMESKNLGFFWVSFAPLPVC